MSDHLPDMPNQLTCEAASHGGKSITNLLLIHTRAYFCLQKT